ncbi:MAG TPA: hypothetical protein DCS28_02530 [Candidatus Moranbacteria bacterium]|nr:hypothetical protein [Candidatus Moranbacteria bacterium]HAT74891.1 hypothetical protein [Candidatus Moranbacteria bacterium]
MTKILIINKYISGKSLDEKRTRVKTENKGSIKISLVGAGFLVVLCIIFMTAFYLFQVNNLAIKGYEVKDLENKISELRKNNKEMQIREMELRSMYAIETAAKNFNLLDSTDITYLEIDGPVAIK